MKTIEKQMKYPNFKHPKLFHCLSWLSLPPSEIQMWLAKEYYPSVFSCAGVVIYIVVSMLHIFYLQTNNYYDIKRKKKKLKKIVSTPDWEKKKIV